MVPGRPPLKQLTERLRAIRPVTLSVTGYRSTTPRYAREADITSGAGSRKFGGRWNPPGIAAVYMCLTPEGAMEETLAHFRYYGMPIHSAMPRTFVAIRARLSRVLDLSDGAVRQRMRISEARMLKTDWRKEMDAGRLPLTQLVGRAAFDAGFEAIRVLSATHTGETNLIVFPENLLRSSSLQVLGTHDLPP